MRYQVNDVVFSPFNTLDEAKQNARIFDGSLKDTVFLRHKNNSVIFEINHILYDKRGNFSKLLNKSDINVVYSHFFKSGFDKETGF
jgi:hypothetical protein